MNNKVILVFFDVFVAMLGPADYQPILRSLHKRFVRYAKPFNIVVHLLALIMCANTVIPSTVGRLI